MAEANLILSQICSAQNGLVHVWRGWKKADMQMLIRDESFLQNSVLDL